MSATNATVPILPFLSPRSRQIWGHAERNTRAGSNPHYSISQTERVVVPSSESKVFARSSEVFSHESYTKVQQEERVHTAALSELRSARYRAAARQAELRVVSSSSRQEGRDAARIDGKRAQREAYEGRIQSLLEKEAHRVRRWL